MKDNVTGLVVDGKKIHPWVFGCWDEDGYQIECDWSPGHDQGPVVGGCTYHFQWVRIAGENAMVAWVEPSEADPGVYESYAWNPADEEHIELCTKVGKHFIDPHDAMQATDEALERFIESYRGAA